MIIQNSLKLLMAASVMTLTACNTMKMPNLDMLRGNAFSEEAQNIDPTIPDVGDAPEVPKDVRSAAEWDKSAREMMAARDSYVPPENLEPALTAEEFEAEFEALKNKTQAYKLDDPIEE